MTEKNIVKKVFGKIWSLLKVYLIGVGIFWTLIPLVLILSLSTGLEPEIEKPKEKPVEVMGDVWVEVPVEGQYTEIEQSDSERLLSKLFQERLPKNIFNFLNKIENLAHTDNVKGVLFRIENFSMSQVHVEAFDKMLAVLKQKGKKIWMHANELDTNSFLFASHADQVAISPAGGVTLLGPTLQQTFFGEALKKIGIDVEVIKSGEYKNAFEAFTRNSPTDETVEVYNSIINEVADRYISQVAKRKPKMNENLVREWLEKSLFTAREAEKDGLVDSVEHYLSFKGSIVKDLVAKSAASAEFSSLSEVTIADTEDYKVFDESKKIAILKYSGDITMQDQGDEGGIYPELVEKDVDWLLEQTDVAGAVVRINSGGGSALASEIIWSHLKRLSEKMPIVASLGSVAASGGYYMAAAANKITASESTITGSIGVIGLIPNVKSFEDKYGVSFHVFSKSQRVNLLNMGSPLSESDKEVMKKSLSDTYDLFLTRVAEGRKMGKNQVDEVARGRVWTAQQAKKAGLVDVIGGLETSYQELKLLAGLDPEKVYPVVKPSYRKNFIECLKSFNVRECMGEDFDVKSFIKHLSLTRPEAELVRQLSERVNLLKELSNNPVQTRMAF